MQSIITCIVSLLHDLFGHLGPLDHCSQISQKRQHKFIDSVDLGCYRCYPPATTGHCFSVAKGDVEIRCLADEASRWQFEPVGARSELISDYLYTLEAPFCIQSHSVVLVQILEWSSCGLFQYFFGFRFQRFWISHIEFNPRMSFAMPPFYPLLLSSF